ncbi:hypothetical protein SALB1_0929 [Salinisphaera sp. LB1]|nr:hypothetical protein SALB1_0929 [Salinisphaera sp. LB1]
MRAIRLPIIVVSKQNRLTMGPAKKHWAQSASSGNSVASDARPSAKSFRRQMDSGAIA